MQNVLLLILLVLISGCNTKEVPVAANVSIHQLELERKYERSSYLIAKSVEEKLLDPQIVSSRNYIVGKEKTTYVNNNLLTVSNEKEQRVYLPYVKSTMDAKFGYEEPKTIRQAKQSTTNTIKFVQIDKNLIYPLQLLKQLPNEFYVPQEEITINKPVEKRESEPKKREIVKNASQSPSFFVLVGDVYIGLHEDLSLAHVYYVRKQLEYVKINLHDTDLNLKFKQITKEKKTALSENNYSIVYLGKKGNTLMFKRVYNNSNKASELREIVMNSPQIEVFGHKILVQTATREALHCIIKN